MSDDLYPAVGIYVMGPQDAKSALISIDGEQITVDPQSRCGIVYSIQVHKTTEFAPGERVIPNLRR